MTTFGPGDRPHLLKVLALHERLIPRYLAERNYRKYYREIDRRRAAIEMLMETGLTGEEIEMCTQYPQIFHDLTEPFGEREIKTLKKGKTISYVTARTVMNRLDSVLGPENWWDEYLPQPTCVICKLTIRLPDGEKITKADAGGHAGMSDEGDDEKSGYSDAFKRAAVKFGVGRHLYEDGIPRFLPDEPANGNGNGKAKPETKMPAKSGPGESGVPAGEPRQGPQTKEEFYAYVKSLDPDGTRGIRADVVKWGLTQSPPFPSMVKDWSDLQARSGYLFVADLIERQQKGADQ